MLKLYYTVSSGYLDIQGNYINSLGGFPSSTEVPNDVFDNLFDEISLSEIKDVKTQYRAIIIKNESEEIIENIELWFEKKDSNICSYQIGATLLSNDEQPFIEHIPSVYSKPLYTQLYDATVDSKVSIGNLNPGQMIGLWLSRTVDKEKALEEYNNVAEEDPLHRSRYKPIEKEKQETVDLKITWD
jgi:hypothetical protein